MQSLSTVNLPPQWDAVLGLIAEHAAQSDSEGVPRSHFNALASVGAHGSQDSIKDPAIWREFTEQLAGADASTWFCWTQHQTPLRTLELGGNAPAAQSLRDQWLPGLRSGDQLAAVAFAHIRRPGPANPVARYLHGTWVLNGTLDWVTSWDIADVLLLMALTEDKKQIVSFIIPIAEFEKRISGSSIGEPLQLLSMSGTHTRPIFFDDCPIPEEYVFDVADFATWHEGDARKTIAPNYAALGLARAAIEELNSVGEARGSHHIIELADALATRYLDLKNRANALVDQGLRAEASELIAARVEILDLARDAASAVVIARAGAGMQAGRSAERRVREAMFLQVQAQTETTRNAALSLMSDRYKR